MTRRRGPCFGRRAFGRRQADRRGACRFHRAKRRKQAKRSQRALDVLEVGAEHQDSAAAGFRTVDDLVLVGAATRCPASRSV